MVLYCINKLAWPFFLVNSQVMMLFSLDILTFFCACFTWSFCLSEWDLLRAFNRKLKMKLKHWLILKMFHHLIVFHFALLTCFHLRTQRLITGIGIIIATGNIIHVSCCSKVNEITSVIKLGKNRSMSTNCSLSLCSCFIHETQRISVRICREFHLHSSLHLHWSISHNFALCDLLITP